MKLNEKIYSCRKKAGMSQLDLADQLGVSRQSVSKWETGEATPEVSKLLSLARLFGVTTDWLLSEEDAPSEAANASSDSAADASAPAAMYPEWVEHLPASISAMVKRFGWIFGVQLAVSGGIFTGMGFLARFMFRTVIFGAGPSGGSFDLYGGTFGTGLSFADPFAEFNRTAWSAASLFTGCIIGFGIVLLFSGIVLAVALKKWGNSHNA